MSIDDPRMQEPVLDVVHLRKHFKSGSLTSLLSRSHRPVRAVDDISFAIARGENFGLVGESGSGKTTMAKLVLRLEVPTDGQILFNGRDIHQMKGQELREFRGASHMVFQDPNSSLSPRMRVRNLVGEPLQVQGVRGEPLDRRVAEVLDLVGLPTGILDRYPHEFSGGQRQRIAIARAIAIKPSFIVLDEPVSALDVSIRSQILNLLKELQEELHLTYLTIAHDLAVVYQACDRTGVMYLGSLVELASSEELFKRPLHPYTQTLLAAIPLPDPKLRPKKGDMAEIGEIPSPSNPPSGCRFHPRCPHAIEKCVTDVPMWREVEPERWVACHRVERTEGSQAVLITNRSHPPLVEGGDLSPTPVSNPIA